MDSTAKKHTPCCLSYNPDDLKLYAHVCVNLNVCLCTHVCMCMWCVCPCAHDSRRETMQGRKESNEKREDNRKKKDCSIMLSLSRNLDSKCAHEGCLVRVRGPGGRAGEDERAVRWEVSKEHTPMKMP